ncbi:CDGSH iron-sulfur domain-containing protein [Embleya scabrispora]|uniref:CDGSH iron-sulfur domain-containing protein n=1 Tax=Embleya scabrispora TaxID=159449 RepID=UPI000592A24F|nr:CDGSH iron-sulfur domain-containing protein [Embleya scabrispora]MYS78721.1 hypothetical protein [Streptomyces sp. SID5474]
MGNRVGARDPAAVPVRPREVHRADERPLEPRNRMTLCRCGHSSGKPLCDGTHRAIGFHEEPTTAEKEETP